MDLGRIGLGIATGGLSEVGQYVTGSDPFGMNRLNHAEELYGGVDPTGQYQSAASGAERFGIAGAQDFKRMGREAEMQRDALRRRAMGADSLSAEQLRQSFMTLQAQQQGAAAGASPSNAAMAARNASNAAAMVGGGLAGQQATAGIQERAAAENALTNSIMTQRGQSMNAALGGQSNALAGYGGIEGNRTSRYGVAAGAPTVGEQFLNAGAGAAALFAKSDRRAKTSIRAGEADADDLLKTLKPYRFRYKDRRDGKGEHVGIMAQDLERSRAGRAAVVDTPGGKMVHGAKLATAIAATLPGLDRRLRKLERRRG